MLAVKGGSQRGPAAVVRTIEVGSVLVNLVNTFVISCTGCYDQTISQFALGFACRWM